MSISVVCLVPHKREYKLKLDPYAKYAWFQRVNKNVNVSLLRVGVPLCVYYALLLDGKVEPPIRSQSKRMRTSRLADKEGPMRVCENAVSNGCRRTRQPITGARKLCTYWLNGRAGREHIWLEVIKPYGPTVVRYWPRAKYFPIRPDLISVNKFFLSYDHISKSLLCECNCRRATRTVRVFTDRAYGPHHVTFCNGSEKNHARVCTGHMINHMTVQNIWYIPGNQSVNGITLVLGQYRDSRVENTSDISWDDAGSGLWVDQHHRYWLSSNDGRQQQLQPARTLHGLHWATESRECHRNSRHGFHSLFHGLKMSNESHLFLWELQISTDIFDERQWEFPVPHTLQWAESKHSN